MEQGHLEDEVCKKAACASLHLLGNVSAHFSVERRKEVMKHLNNDIKFLAETEFPQSGPYLFGDDFETKAKTAADNIRALKGLQSNKNHFSVPAALTKRQIHVPGSPNKLGCLPTISQISLQPAGKVTTLCTTETSQVQQDSKQGGNLGQRQ